MTTSAIMPGLVLKNEPDWPPPDCCARALVGVRGVGLATVVAPTLSSEALMTPGFDADRPSAPAADSGWIVLSTPSSATAGSLPRHLFERNVTVCSSCV